ncbi:hypothetical protein BFG07_14075 [Kosakonia cowanii]|nr:hypothetical protein BFG07_14075 [Kosakonia cowanii]
MSLLAGYGLAGMAGLIATGYYVAGFAGRSGGCQNGVFFSLISAGMCLRHIQGRAVHCSRSLDAEVASQCRKDRMNSFYRRTINAISNILAHSHGHFLLGRKFGIQGI